MKNMICERCGAEFQVKDSRAKTARYCNKYCHIEHLRKNHPIHNSKHTEESKKKMSKSRVGRIPWNKGKEYIQIIGEKHWNWKGGKVTKQCPNCSVNFKSFPSDERKYCSKECYNEGHNYPKREKHHNWKGDRKLKDLIRKDAKNINWIKTIFERDNYTCQLCEVRGGNGKKIILNAHHIVPFHKIIDDNDIKSLKEADECQELWDVNNGITLCNECHLKEHFGE